MKVTVELLDALLSSNLELRRNAEQVFYSISIVERCQELLQHIYVIVTTTTTSGSSSSEGRGMLCAVLLRRDIGRLAWIPEMTTNVLWDIIHKYHEPLFMDMTFLLVSSSSSSVTVTTTNHPSLSRFMRQHVLVELCSTFYLLDATKEGQTFIKQPLTTIVFNTTTSTIPNKVRWEWLSEIAQRAPVALWSVTSVEDWIPLWNTTTTTTMMAVEDLPLWVQAFCRVALASEVTTASSSSADRMEQLQLQLEHQLLVESSSTTTTTTNKTLDIHSNSAIMGRQCLPFITSQIQSSICCSSNRIIGQQCLEELTLGSPSLLCQDGWIDICLQMGGGGNQSTDVAIVCLELISKVLPHMSTTTTTTTTTTTYPQVFPYAMQCWVQGLENDWTDDDDDDDEEEELAEQVSLLMEGLLEQVPHFVQWSVMENMLSTTSMTEWKHWWVLFQLQSLCLSDDNNNKNKNNIPPPSLLSKTMTVCQHVLQNANANNNHVRLQWAALEWYGKMVQSTPTDNMEWMIGFLQSPCAKLQQQACTTLILCLQSPSDDESSALLNVSTRVWQALPLDVQRYSSRTVTQALLALAALAQAIPSQQLAPLYPELMPGLLSLLHQSTSIDMVVRGTALETAAMILQSMPHHHSRMVQDATTLLTFIVSSNPDHHVGMDYLVASSARLASVIPTADFAQHWLPQVLPPLLTILNQSPSNAISIQTNGNGNSKDQVVCCLPGMEAASVSMNHAYIQEQEIAIRALYEYAQVDNGQLLQPHFQSCFEATVPHIASNPYLRVPAAQTTISLLEQQPQSQQPDYIHKIAHLLITQIQTTDQQQELALVECLSDLCYLAWKKSNTTTNSNCAVWSKEIVMAMVDLMIRSSDEEELLMVWVDVVGYTIKTMKQAMIPIFQQVLVPKLGPWLQQWDHPKARWAATCLWDDVVEHGSPCPLIITQALCQSILQTLLLQQPQQASTTNLELQEASVYGLAQLARYAPQVIVSVPTEQMSAVMTQLCHIMMTSLPSNDDDQFVRLQQNATSAMASLALFPQAPLAKGVGVSVGELLPLLLSQLPLTEDPDEAKICHLGVLDMVLRGDIDLMAHAPKVLQLMGELSSSLEEEEDNMPSKSFVEIQQPIQTLYQLLQTRLSPHEFTQLFTTLEPNHQNGLREITAI